MLAGFPALQAIAAELSWIPALGGYFMAMHVRHSDTAAWSHEGEISRLCQHHSYCHMREIKKSIKAAVVVYVRGTHLCFINTWELGTSRLRWRRMKQAASGKEAVDFILSWKFYPFLFFGRVLLFFPVLSLLWQNGSINWNTVCQGSRMRLSKSSGISRKNSAGGGVTKKHNFVWKLNWSSKLNQGRGNRVGQRLTQCPLVLST